MRRTIPDVGYFYAIEQNPSRDGHHVHALWANCDEVLRRDVWRKWFDRYGRSRIEPCRSREDVAGYCSKYVTKEGAWWNFKLDHQTWLNLRKQDKYEHTQDSAMQSLRSVDTQLHQRPERTAKSANR